LGPIWFLAGVLFTLSAIILLLPWLRTVPRLGSLPALPWQAGAGAVLTMVAITGLWLWLLRADPAVETHSHQKSSEPIPTADSTDDSWAGIANALERGAGKVSDTTQPPTRSNAQPMAGAIVSLQARLAKGGGSADDWELLAKSYEFLGRTADATKVRAHQLPPLPVEDTATPSATASDTRPPGQLAMAVSGSVSLAPGLKAKAATGRALFIVAKSVDSPGPPVAVYRTTVDRWPVKFELDDSQSMLPTRKLSSAGRFTVEARISQSGQPLPASGDLQGATGVVDPADRRPLEILIDKVIE
jgi:hypothetical protein